MALVELLNLGPIQVSDFLAPGEEPRHPPVELALQMDEETGIVRLRDVVDPAHMYGRYWYRSGINPSMRADLADVVDQILKLRDLGPGEVWLDIACNDGTLLSNVPADLLRVGIDPADDSFKWEAELYANIVVQDFFSAAAYPLDKRASVVTCIAMFYDLDDPMPFLKDVHSVLSDDGVFVIQASYTPLMVEQMAFDNICHEHAHYYTLKTLSHVLGKAGFVVMDCQLNTTNGGSFRVYAMKADSNPATFSTQPYRDVARYRVESILAYEALEGYNTPQVWKTFAQDLEQLRSDVRGAVLDAVAAGKTVAAYGASTKGNTLLPYFGLDNTLISYAVERSPAKFGLRTAGTNIPIISEEEMRNNPPDIMLILPWCFADQMIQRERAFLEGGGTFIVPCPVFRTVTAADL